MKFPTISFTIATLSRLNLTFACITAQAFFEGSTITYAFFGDYGTQASAYCTLPQGASSTPVDPSGRASLDCDGDNKENISASVIRNDDGGVAMRYIRLDGFKNLDHKGGLMDIELERWGGDTWGMSVEC